MSDSESLHSDHKVTLNPNIAARVTPAPQRVLCKGHEYLRHPGTRAASDALIIWRVGEEYERKGKRY
jgi:hypothetical protein